MRPAVDWDAMLDLRSAVARELEKVRNSGAIGAPLDAEVDLYCAPALLQTLEPFGEELRFVFIASGARVHPAESRPADAAPAQDDDRNAAWIVVRPTNASKCVRCWHKGPDVGSSTKHPELCGRCVTNIETAGEDRKYT